LNPAVANDDFDAAVAIAQAEFDRHRPDVVVASWRGVGNPLAEWHGDGVHLQPLDGGQSVIASRAASIQAPNTGKAQMADGTIRKLIPNGFGFIETESGKDLFFHSTSVQDVSFHQLRVGQKVSYTEGQGLKGPCAENVKPV
jgi:CspA family cold shock protein